MHAYPVPVKMIVSFVVALHAVLLIWLLWLAPVTPIPAKPKPFAVQTIQLHARKQPVTKEPAKVDAKQVTSPTPPAAKASPPKAEPVKAPPKPASKVATKPTPKQPTKKATTPNSKTAAKEVAQAEPPKKKLPTKDSLDALKAKLAAIPNTAAMANTSQNKANEGISASNTVSFAYEDELISRLKFLLKLPEIGDVKVSLTLNRQGKVVKSEILSSASATNRKAVETHLPSIHFPPFGQAYAGENTHTFTLTLTNL